MRGRIIQATPMHFQEQERGLIIRCGDLALFVGLLLMIAQASRATEQAPAFEILNETGPTMLGDLRGHVGLPRFLGFVVGRFVEINYLKLVLTKAVFVI